MAGQFSTSVSATQRCERWVLAEWVDQGATVLSGRQDPEAESLRARPVSGQVTVLPVILGRNRKAQPIQRRQKAKGSITEWAVVQSST